MTAEPADRPQGLAAYRSLLAHVQVRRLMVYGFVARLREGGIGLALVLLTRHATGSFAIAGGVSATFYLCSAVMRPVQGRWMDRVGHRRVLTIAVVVNSLLLFAAVGLAGTLGVARASGSRAAGPRYGHRKRTSPLTADVRKLLTIAFFVGLAEGPLTVSLTAAATRDRLAAASGPLISALAVGSVLGVLFYGARSWKMQPPARLAIYTTMLAAALLALSAASSSVAALAPAAIVVGVALAPAITSIAICVNATAPPQAMAEAFAWISFATPCGAAAAQTLAGTLAAGPGPRWGFIEGAAGASLAAVLAATTWRHQSRNQPAETG